MRLSAPATPRHVALLVVALVVVATTLFLGSVTGEFVWDDIFLIETNTRLGEPGYWWHAIQSPFPYLGMEAQKRWGGGMYRPLISLLYGAEHQLWGLHTFGYHLLNLGLHAACTVLVFQWVRRRLSADGAGGAAATGGVVGALFFAVHPARAESVAWISGCTDLCMTFLLLLGLTAWDRIARIPGALVTAVLVLLALGCKENAAVVPFALAADGVLRGPGAKEKRTQLIRAGVVLAVLIPGLALRFHFAPFGEHEAMHLSPLGFARASTAVLGGYLRMLLWPWPPSVCSGFLPPDDLHGGLAYPAAQVALGSAGLLLCLVLMSLAWWRVGARAWLADLAWFLFALAPNLLPTNDWHQISERNLYLPSLGVAALVGRGIVAARRSQTASRVALGGALAAFLVWGISAAAHTRHFDSNDALWSYETRLHPTDTMGLINLAEVRSGQGRYDEARRLKERAIRAATSHQVHLGIFEDWIEAEFDSATTDSVQLRALGVALDTVAAGNEPVGDIGGVYRVLDTVSRQLLVGSVSFRVLRALVTASTGNCEVALSEAGSVRFEEIVNRQGLEAMRIVSVLVGCGGISAARFWMESVPSPLHEDVARLVSSAADALGGHPPPAVAQARLGSVLMAGGDPLVALATLQKALVLAPPTAPVVADVITLDAELWRLPEAQEYLTELSRLDPKLAAERAPLVQVLASIVEKNNRASAASN